jgi:hypothetical protein
VLIFLVSLLLIIFAVMAIPVDLNFTLQREDTFQGRASIGWLFGLVRIPLQPRDKKARQPKKPQKKKKAERRRSRRDGLHVSAMLRSQGFLSRLIRLLRRLRGCIHIRQLRLQVLMGLDDPADTGQLWGIVGPLTLALPVPAGANVAIQPEFTGATFQVDGEGSIRIVPIEIIGTLIAFAFSPVTLRALYALSTGR